MSVTPPPVLPLSGLAQRHMTPAVSIGYEEAARVCLDRHHQSPTWFEVADENEVEPTQAEWIPADARCRAAHQHFDDATEAGAYACALAAVDLTRGLVAIGRAHKLTGADFYLNRHGTHPEDLEDALRLEVSGIDHGTAADFKARVRAKLQQARHGKSDLPALVSVVGFQAGRIAIQALISPSP